MEKILSPLRRAVEDYQMIESGDRIAVGVSGGKDSMALLLSLNALASFYPKPFRVVGISIDPGLDGMSFAEVEAFCQKNQIEYHVKETQIGKIVFDVRKEKNPCSLCAKLRRGALNNAALEYGCNKIALGHHADDVIDTLLLNLVHEGRFGCFSPVTFLDRKQVTVIRPLLYVKEGEIRSCIRRNGIPLVQSTCPANGETERASMHRLCDDLQKQYPDIREKLFGALQRSGVDGWGTDGIRHGRKT